MQKNLKVSNIADHAMLGVFDIQRWLIGDWIVYEEGYKNAKFEPPNSSVTCAAEKMRTEKYASKKAAIVQEKAKT